MVDKAAGVGAGSKILQNLAEREAQEAAGKPVAPDVAEAAHVVEMAATDGRIDPGEQKALRTVGATLNDAGKAVINAAVAGAGLQRPASVGKSSFAKQYAQLTATQQQIEVWLKAHTEAEPAGAQVRVYDLKTVSATVQTVLGRLKELEGQGHEPSYGSRGEEVGAWEVLAQQLHAGKVVEGGDYQDIPNALKAMVTDLSGQLTELDKQPLTAEQKSAVQAVRAWGKATVLRVTSTDLHSYYGDGSDLTPVKVDDAITVNRFGGISAGPVTLESTSYLRPLL